MRQSKGGQPVIAFFVFAVACAMTLTEVSAQAFHRHSLTGQATRTVTLR